MYEYTHGGDIYSAAKLTGGGEILDFSANINPLGMPEAVKDAIAGALEYCVNYPDPFYRDLVAALAEYEKTDQKHILCANGASEIIFRLSLAIKPKKALLFAPTFTDYERALKTVGCTVQYYFLTAGNGFSARLDFLDYIDGRTDMVIICNPNNPTGQVCPKPFMDQVIEKCRRTNAVVLVDECFMDFVDSPEQYSVQPNIATCGNLLVLKAFTKIFAMPGIRLGYVLSSNTGILEQMRMSGQDWSVSMPAQAAGICALKQREYLRLSRRLVRKERKYLIDELQRLGFQVHGSRANYIFFRAAGLADLDKKLVLKGILIRSCANYVNLNSEYFRVAVKKRAENIRLIAAIREVAGEKPAASD